MTTNGQLQQERLSRGSEIADWSTHNGMVQASNVQNLVVAALLKSVGVEVPEGSLTTIPWGNNITVTPPAPAAPVAAAAATGALSKVLPWILGPVVGGALAIGAPLLLGLLNKPAAPVAAPAAPATNEFPVSIDWNLNSGAVSPKSSSTGN
jgi:hypothetical protein